MTGAPRHIYLHVPFCARICPYCDFAVTVGAGADLDRWWAAQRREWVLMEAEGLFGRATGQDRTLFLGGGTPSWLSPERLGDLLTGLVTLTAGGWSEATCEINPEHADPSRLAVMKEGGITRLSLGVQSFEEEVLRRLGRVHTPRQVIEASERARRLGLDLSLDLIFAVPGQTQLMWRRDLEQALALEPDHLSLYNLTWEPGTAYARRRDQGRLRSLSPEWEAQAYRWAVERLAGQGYRRYEVSNFARPGKESTHNRAYWEGVDYLGLGPSAHSYLAGVRRANPRSLTEWARVLLEEDRVAWEWAEELDALARARERVLLGLRTDRGFALEELDPSFRSIVRGQADPLVRRGLALWEPGERLRLTDAGMLVADAMAAEVAP